MTAQSEICKACWLLLTHHRVVLNFHAVTNPSSELFSEFAMQPRGSHCCCIQSVYRSAHSIKPLPDHCVFIGAHTTAADFMKSSHLKIPHEES